MTPRESLEAAGWIRTPLYQGRWTDPVTKISCSEAAAILTQLARDEAKETSDGSVKEKVQLETVSVPYVSSPVAGNVATQGYAQNSVQSAPVVSEMLGKYLNTMVADLHIEGNGQYLRGLFSKFEREYASSSSAALRADFQSWLDKYQSGELDSDSVRAAEEKSVELQEQIKQALAVIDTKSVIIEAFCRNEKAEIKKLRERAEAAEAKVAELRGQLEVRETLAAADLEKLKELEDNSAQDEREIEALQESLRTVRQDLADRDGIIIGLQDVAAGKTRPLTDIEAELRGNKS